MLTRPAILPLFTASVSSTTHQAGHGNVCWANILFCPITFNYSDNAHNLVLIDWIITILLGECNYSELYLPILFKTMAVAQL